MSCKYTCVRDTTKVNEVTAAESRYAYVLRDLALPFQVRRVRRCNSSSPDSDDTYGGEEDEVGLGKDDQYLVSDRTENKFYGSVHAAAAASSCGSAHQYPGNTPIIGPPLNYLQRRLQVVIEMG